MVKTIGLIGDSIGHGFFDKEDTGWFNRLAKMILQDYDEDCFFNNMSQAGDNIADTANRAISEVLSRRFDILIVSTGINDLRRRKSCGYELDFSEGARMMYWQRLLDILSYTKAQIVVTDLLPVVENRYTSHADLIRRNSDVERYNEQLCELCNERNIKFFARYPHWQKRNLEKLYFDATHPNTVGHKMVAEEIYAFLQKEKLLTPKKYSDE